MLPQLDGYYQLKFSSDGTGGYFEFEINVSRAGMYSGTGTEMGNGSASGEDQLVALAQGIASGIEAQSAPYWDNISLISIVAPPNEPIQLHP